ncbi:hypothetical protein SDRG_00343, partial [Saprolegnia diclina VS20]
MYPTLCKPQTLDIERRRVVLSEREYKSVRYHEPMAGKSKHGMAFYLVAIGRSKIYLFDLQKTTSRPIVLPMNAITSLAKVIPTKFGSERQILLCDDSELYALTLRDDVGKAPSTYYLASFEAASKAFVYLDQSWAAYLERCVLSPKKLTTSSSQTTLLFHAIVAEFADTSDIILRQRLLLELSQSAVDAVLLKRLFFNEDTMFRSGDALCHGLPSLLLHLLRQLNDRSASDLPRVAQLEFVLALLGCYHAMVFDSHTLVERQTFLKRCGHSFCDVAAVFALNYTKGEADTALSEHDKTIARTLRMRIIETQAAILLQLYAFHHELIECFPDTSLAPTTVHFFDLMVAAPTYHKWFQRAMTRAGLLYAATENDKTLDALRLYWLVSVIYLTLASNYRVRAWICDDCFDTYTLLWCSPGSLARWTKNETNVFATRAATHIQHILRACAES